MKRPWLLVLPLLLLAAACSSGSSSDLDGKTFQSIETTGFDLAEDTRITMSFSDNQITVNAGCNTLFGEITWKGSQLHTDGLATTEMGCAAELHDQDTLLADLLMEAPTLTLEYGTLQVTGTANGKDIGITLVELEDAPLVGTLWELSGIIAHESVSSLPAGVSSTMSIHENNHVDVQYACNQGGGSVEVADGTLIFGPLASTRMMCQPDVMDVENHVMSVLDGEVTYEIRLGTLTIMNGDIGLHYSANR